MKIEGYIGICGACFEPIKDGDGHQFRQGGRHFHKDCCDTKANNYYIALERIRADFESEKNPTDLMNEMERIFKIPMINDPVFNQDNEDVISLYREISNSRQLV